MADDTTPEATPATTPAPAEAPETTPAEPESTVSETEPDTQPETPDTQPDAGQQDSEEESNPNREAARYRVRLREAEQERDDLKRTVHALQLGALGTVLGKGEYKAAMGAEEALLEELEPYQCWREDKLDYSELANALTNIRERKPYLFDYNRAKNAQHAIADAIKENPNIKQEVFDRGICPYDTEEEIIEWCRKFNWYISHKLPTRDQAALWKSERESRNGLGRPAKGHSANPVAEAIRASRRKE